MTRLWDKGTPLDARGLGYTAGDDYVLDNRLVRYDIQASIAHAEMLNVQGLLRALDLESIRAALTAIGEEHARGAWRVSLGQEDCQTAIENLLTSRIQMALPGYTHMQQAMPSTVELWAQGFAAEIRDDAEGLGFTQRRIDKNPLGSAAGYGTPNLDLSREETRRRLGFVVTQEPVTAVQLSRGKAEAGLLFEITLLAQDCGRLAADLLLFYTQEFGFVTLPAAFTTGSSIMPQKRNPDVFELVRGRSAVAQAALNEVLGITQKLTSGYHRDLQLIKPPLFRAIDSCLQTLEILPSALDGVSFRPENIRLDPGIGAAADANALVAKEGIPFREAYRRVAAKFKDTE
jgi:argininosuccinate lyase